MILAGGAVAASALAYYLKQSSNGPIDSFYDFDNQSIEIDVKEYFLFIIWIAYVKNRFYGRNRNIFEFAIRSKTDH
jgi:hypothetical protein